MTNLDILINDIKNEFPEFELIQKSKSLLMKSIDLFLKIISFGQMIYFMSKFTTVIGNKVYTSQRWEFLEEKSKLIVLRHERVHMRQRQKYGSLLFSFLYLFFPLPFIFSYYRMKFEMEAYVETIKAVLELNENGKELIQSKEYKEHFFKYFTNASYVYMWPFKKTLEKWWEKDILSLIK